MGKKFVGLDGLKHFWKQAKIWIGKRITGEVTAKIAEIVADAPEDLDTLKEIADWISAHADSASEMNTQINTNKNDIAALQTSVAEKAAASHTHDDRYYTESEIDTKLSGKADKAHTHTKSQITDFPTSLKNPNALTVNGKIYDGSSAVDAGVQTVANGGTGATDAAGGFNTLADGVRDSSTPGDDEKMLLKPTGTWYKTTCLDFWNYINGKISSVLGLTKDNYGGKASTAGTADSATTAAKLGRDGNTGIPMTFNWSGQGGQPSWLWGGNDGSNMYVYNPSNFSVNTAKTADVANYLSYEYGNEINFKGGAKDKCYFNYRNADTGDTSRPVDTISYLFCNYGGDTDKSNIIAGSFNGITAKATSKMVIPIGAPSSLEDGCIWIER